MTATLKTECESRTDGWQTVIKSLFLILATYLARRHTRKKTDTGTPFVRMTNVIEHIQEHFHEPIRVEELARLAHWSPSQFQRNFKRAYSTTAIRFINQVRLREACELLRDPNRDITTIAFETGFCSSSFFALQFKRQMGQSPSEYRRLKLGQFGGQVPKPGPIPGLELATKPTPNGAIRHFDLPLNALAARDSGNAPPTGPASR